MLRDITIGQYFPGHSFIHKMDPRMKIIAAVLYIVVLFVASRPLGLALGIAIVVLMYAVSKISPKMVVKSLKPVVPIIIFTAVLNLFSSPAKATRCCTSVLSASTGRAWQWRL